MTFQSPNYTQTPNDLFDLHMANMSGGELKIVLAAVRKTIGFHKKREAISISQFQEMTGLSRRHVISAIDEAVAHGYIKEVGTGRRGTKKYELSIKEHTATSEIIAPVLVQKGNQSDTATSEIIAPTKEISTKRKEINKHIASDDAAVEKPQKTPAVRTPRQGDAEYDAIKAAFPNISTGEILNLRGMLCGIGSIRGEWNVNKLEKLLTIEEVLAFGQYRMARAERGKISPPSRPEVIARWVNEWRAETKDAAPEWYQDSSLPPPQLAILTDELAPADIPGTFTPSADDFKAAKEYIRQQLTQTEASE